MATLEQSFKAYVEFSTKLWEIYKSLLADHSDEGWKNFVDKTTTLSKEYSNKEINRIGFTEDPITAICYATLISGERLETKAKLNGEKVWEDGREDAFDFISDIYKWILPYTKVDKLNRDENFYLKLASEADQKIKESKSAFDIPQLSLENPRKNIIYACVDLISALDILSEKYEKQEVKKNA